MAHKKHEAPKYLDTAAKLQWEKLYSAELARAKVNYPNNEQAQHTSALKAANAMLTVAAPESAKEIDALQPWQVVKREDRVIGGKPHRVAVTIDGRKHVHPVEAKNVKPPAAPKDANKQDKTKGADKPEGEEEEATKA